MGGARQTSRKGRSALPQSRRAARCREKFLTFYPGGFYDEDYLGLERSYKWDAHRRWDELLNRERFNELFVGKHFREIAETAVRIESRTNLLFSFEKMALRDAIRDASGAELFARGLYDWLYRVGSEEQKFSEWVAAVATLPRIKTRVLTWPIATVFGFIAQPKKHIFLKPNVTRIAAHEYGFEFNYVSKPNWSTYQNLIDFAHAVRSDLKDLRPRDMIDLQSFIWVQGSNEYD